MSLWGGLFAVGMRGENEQRSSEATQTQSLNLRSRKTCMKQEIKDIKTVAMSGSDPRGMEQSNQQGENV